MDTTLTSPLQELQQWLGGSSQSRHPTEYVRKRKLDKASKCGQCTPFSFEESATKQQEIGLAHCKTARLWVTKVRGSHASTRALSAAVASVVAESTAAKFQRLASEWSREVENISSVSALTSHPKYKEIVNLGWDVIPYLLKDLEQRRGYWFPALNAITGIRPFDPRVAGNIDKMTDAWIRWGINKRII